MRFGYVPLRVKRYFHDNDLPDVSGRIIMPLFDLYGELVAVTTRDMRDAEDPYYKKHWHESFEKGQYLFGMDLARREIVSKKAALVVEGQFDVAYLRSIGIGHVVAAMGGVLSSRHASLLARYCSTVYLFFDGDEGGRKATQRAMQMHDERGLDGLGITYIPVNTPAGKDPDDFDLRQVISLCRTARENALVA